MARASKIAELGENWEAKDGMAIRRIPVANAKQAARIAAKAVAACGKLRVNLDISCGPAEISIGVRHSGLIVNKAQLGVLARLNRAIERATGAPQASGEADEEAA